MSQAPAPDDSPAPQLSARAGAVLGVAIVLLLALLPGMGPQRARPLSAIGAAHVDQPFLAAAHRLSEARAELGKARPDFGDAPVLLAAAMAAAILLLAAASLRAPLIRARALARRPSTVRARAPPRA